VTDHGHFVLINVYVPNAGGGNKTEARLRAKLDFLRLLADKADGLAADGREVMIVGDLNIAASQKDVHHFFNHDTWYTPEELAALKRLTSRYTDVWRELHPEEDNTFTCWDEYRQRRAPNEGCRIDYILLTPELRRRVVSCEVLLETNPKWSDHAGVLIELKGLDPLPLFPPALLSSRRMKAFNDRSQPSIRSMFAPRKRFAGASAVQPLAKRLQRQPASNCPPASQPAVVSSVAASIPVASTPAEVRQSAAVSTEIPEVEDLKAPPGPADVANQSRTLAQVITAAPSGDQSTGTAHAEGTEATSAWEAVLTMVPLEGHPVATKPVQLTSEATSEAAISALPAGILEAVSHLEAPVSPASAAVGAPPTESAETPPTTVSVAASKQPSAAPELVCSTKPARVSAAASLAQHAEHTADDHGPVETDHLSAAADASPAEAPLSTAQHQPQQQQQQQQQATKRSGSGRGPSVVSARTGKVVGLKGKSSGGRKPQAPPGQAITAFFKPKG